MITEDYCSYEIAKLLKEKGFNCECQGYYEIPTELSSHKNVHKQLFTLPKNWNDYGKECVVCEYVSIPTHQMSLKWLRKEQNLYIEIRRNLNTFYFRWKVEQGAADKAVSEYKYDTYEQAVEAALLYVLKNLI